MHKLTLLFVNLLATPPLLGAEPLRFREELLAAAPIICAGTKSPSPQSLWKLGLYDAQLNVMSTEQLLEDKDLVEKAQKEAQLRQHHGYAFGRCQEGRSWIVTSPASAALLTITSKEIRVRSQALQAYCESFDLDFAAAKGGQPRSLLKKSAPQTVSTLINPAFLQAGTLAVTCHPPDSARQGPVLWALAPVLHEDGSMPISQLADIKDFQNWLQKRRKEQGLNTLKMNPPELHELAEELSQEKSLKHPRALLRERGKTLKKKKISLLGENRAAAQDLSEMAWLLWNSPQHRRLLLNPKANSMGLSLKENNGEKQLVMVLGKL